MSTSLCEHCGRAFRSSGALSNHLRACRPRPEAPKPLKTQWHPVGEWKVFALCGQRPELQCRRCLRFSSLVLCRCDEPDFVPLSQSDWTNFFYPEREGGQGARHFRVLGLICGQCPVQQPCLDYADAHGDVYGFWGGLGPRHRELAWRGLTVTCAGCGAVVRRNKATQTTCFRQACKAARKAELANV